ncbi:ABC transporter ATP-binding protein [Desulfococcaceae bacterium HSG9]|nr:ABC transporter ATP-binding protein [Desulfococcaceae bacterium HSG9]
MNKDIVIKVQNLSKSYKLYDKNSDRVKETFHPFRKKYHRTFDALKDVSFEVKKGEALGIIGRNGSGKSTLLQLICGVSTPTAGGIEVKGRIGALLELGAGFDPDFTGRENVYLNGAILGFSNEEINSLFDEIEAFAEIGEFIDQPVKLYSSGMYVRLAFAVQACLNPDILIVDEALSVGDIFFSQKCHARMEALLEKGTSLLFVTHGMGDIEKYCSQALLLINGAPRFYGDPAEAIALYYNSIDERTIHIASPSLNEDDGVKTSAIAEFEEIKKRYGSEYQPNLSKSAVIGNQDMARCTFFKLCDYDGQPCKIFESGEIINIYYEYEILTEFAFPFASVTIWTDKNIPIYCKTTLKLADSPSIVQKGALLQFRHSIKLDLNIGQYTAAIGLNGMKPDCYDKIGAVPYTDVEQNFFRVLSIKPDTGSFDILPKHKGLAIPVIGYVDLDTECSIGIASAC